MRKVKIEDVKDFFKRHPLVLQLVCAVALATVMSILTPAFANGGSEWAPLWQKVQDYITGVPGKIAATFLVGAAIFSFYRGLLAQGGIAILSATGLVLAPKIADSIATGALLR